VCGVRCAVCGVRCAVCGVRCAVCGVRCAVCGVVMPHPHPLRCVPIPPMACLQNYDPSQTWYFSPRLGTLGLANSEGNGYRCFEVRARGLGGGGGSEGGSNALAAAVRGLSPLFWCKNMRGRMAVMLSRLTGGGGVFCGTGGVGN
jgi:hypothetical protein